MVPLPFTLWALVPLAGYLAYLDLRERRRWHLRGRVEGRALSRLRSVADLALLVELMGGLVAIGELLVALVRGGTLEAMLEAALKGALSTLAGIQIALWAVVVQRRLKGLCPR